MSGTTIIAQISIPLNWIIKSFPHFKILNMSSVEVVCCKKLPNITDELSIEANSVDPEQTAPIAAV